MGQGSSVDHAVGHGKFLLKTDARYAKGDILCDIDDPPLFHLSNSLKRLRLVPHDIDLLAKIRIANRWPEVNPFF